MHYQTTFITGIHTGLGNALAQTLLDQGTEVFAVSRQRPDGLNNSDQLRFRALDLANLAAVPGALRELLSPVKRLDLVVLNAGVMGQIKDLPNTSLKDIAAVMDVNVWANKLIFDTLLEMDVDVRQVVAISSGAANNGSAGLGAYSISKAALNLMFRVYAHENPITHIICLAPGLVQTQMLDSMCQLDADEQYPAIGQIRSAIGTDRMQTTSQAAKRLLEVCPRLLEYPTGSFVDIREM